MNNKYLKKLEYNKILDILSSYATTYIGKETALNLIPSTSIENVSLLQKQTTEATYFIMKKGSIPINNIDDITISLKRLDTNGTLNTKELLQIANILKISRRLKDYNSGEDSILLVKNKKQHLIDNTIPENNFDTNAGTITDKSILSVYFNTLYSNANVENMIFDKILEEDIIDDNASPELFYIRRKQKNLEMEIKNKLNSFLHSSKYSKFLQEQISTIRNDRIVIPVKQEYRNEISGFVHDSSASGSTVFIEPMIIFELNNQIRDLKIQETIEIEKILKFLSSEVAKIVEQLYINLETIGILDFIFAKAKYSLSIKGIEPILNIEKFIDIKKARHPLIDKSVVVPVDIHIGKNFSSLIITGPNTGGKTVTLKTVGLLCLMANSGLHIPTQEKSSIHVFKNIYADIGDEQSIEQSLSTFSSHMTNIVSILNTADNNSLILLDELGSGTDPIEGAALAISILEHLYSKNITTLATTHYSELKNFALITDGFENASCEFNVETLSPTYKLLIGVPGKSNAFSISKKLGLCDKILNKANSLIDSDVIHMEDVIKNMQNDKKIIEQEKEDSIKLHQEVENLKKELSEQNELLLKEKQKILNETNEKARNILLQAKEDADSTIRDLINLSKLQSSNKNKLAEEKRKHLKSKLDTLNNNASVINHSDISKIKPTDIKLGLEIYLVSLNKNAFVLSLPDKDGDLMVQSGIVKLKTNLKDISIKTNTDTTINGQMPLTVKNTILKSQHITPEINLIGHTVDESIYILEKYIDDASLANLQYIRIVHGKGTGALKKGIHNYLKNNPHVKSFRIGVFGEGEMGVTIAELK